jgi:hypothetical protein
MKQWEWKLCDHKWNNLKRWVDAFTEGKDDADMMRVLSLKEMVNAIDSGSFWVNVDKQKEE